MKISLAGLKQGVHDIHLDGLPAACGLQEHEHLRNPISVDCQVDKGSHHLYLLIRVRTPVRLECDRCLEEFDLQLDEEGRIIYSSDADLISDSDGEIRHLDPNVQEIDVSEEVREMLTLALPLKRLCADDCKGLCSQCGTNLNEGSCQCRATTVDSRWQVLKDLLDKKA